MAEPGDDRERAARLRALEARLGAVRNRKAPAPRMKMAGIGQAGMAWRMIVELVTGLMIGFGIGYGLDWLFGTGPWLLVVFVLFGFAAGVNVMLHTAREVSAQARDAGQKDEG